MAGTFNEILGREVDLPDEPKRIVSFSPAATETLFRLGLGQFIVGVSAFCARPPEARFKRKVGSYDTVRKELLRELNPDLVVTVTGYQREFAIGLAEEFPVYPLELPLSVSGVVDFVVKTGLIAGAPERGRTLSRNMLRRLGKMKKVSRVQAYVEIDLGGPVSFGANSYITDAFDFLGAETVYGGRRREWLTPDPEEVRLVDPDAIFYEPKMYTKFGRADMKRLLSARGWGEMRAVKTGNVFVTPGPLDFMAHHGPSFVTQAMPWLEVRLGEASKGLRR